MVHYRSCEISVNKECLKLSVDYCIQFENQKQDENYCINLPERIVDTIKENFPPSDFDFYQVCFVKMQNDKVNRVTDYKGVWGLLSRSDGLASGSSITEKHKIYYGIALMKGADLSQCKIIICAPKKHGKSYKDIFAYIENLDANCFDSLETLAGAIYQQDSKLYIASWDVYENIEVSVYGDIKQVFSEEAITKLTDVEC